VAIHESQVLDKEHYNTLARDCRPSPGARGWGVKVADLRGRTDRPPSVGDGDKCGDDVNDDDDDDDDCDEKFTMADVRREAVRIFGAMDHRIPEPRGENSILSRKPFAPLVRLGRGVGGDGRWGGAAFGAAGDRDKREKEEGNVDDGKEEEDEEDEEEWEETDVMYELCVPLWDGVS
jgi:hypothetical protein